MILKRYLSPTAALLTVMTLASCYHEPYPVTYEERAASDQRRREIEDENFYYRDRERRSAGQAGNIHYHSYGDPASTSGAKPVW